MDERERSGFERGMASRQPGRMPARTLGEATTQHAAVPVPPPMPRELAPRSTFSRLPAKLSPREEALWSPNRRKPEHKRHPLIALGAGVAVIVTIVLSLGWTLWQGAQSAGHGSYPTAKRTPSGTEQVDANGKPIASGHGPESGPWTASAAVVPIYTSTARAEPCNDSVMFVDHIDNWTVPPGCYGNVYAINPKDYPYAYGFGWCNWWVREHHLKQPDITENKAYDHGNNPVPGAAIFFFGNVQGADSAGHWAQLVAIAPDHYWMLISEMNFAWRGAGWGRVDFRYVHMGPGVVFVYA
ncbi:MAG TPA: hypothetical protein VF807_03195 [Ktedonobacterales bacterium]